MNLPVDFIKRTSDLLGEEQFAAFCEALSKESPVSIRVNRLKTDAVPEGGHRVPWCDTGYYLIGCRGVIQAIICLPVPRLRSTLCFMLDVIMYKRLLRCFSNKS